MNGVVFLFFTHILKAMYSIEKVKKIAGITILSKDKCYSINKGIIMIEEMLYLQVYQIPIVFQNTTRYAGKIVVR